MICSHRVRLVLLFVTAITVLADGRTAKRVSKRLPIRFKYSAEDQEVAATKHGGGGNETITKLIKDR